MPFQAPEEAPEETGPRIEPPREGALRPSAAPPPRPPPEREPRTEGEQHWLLDYILTQSDPGVGTDAPERTEWSPDSEESAERLFHRWGWLTTFVMQSQALERKRAARTGTEDEEDEGETGPDSDEPTDEDRFAPLRALQWERVGDYVQPLMAAPDRAPENESDGMPSRTGQDRDPGIPAATSWRNAIPGASPESLPAGPRDEPVHLLERTHRFLSGGDASRAGTEREPATQVAAGAAWRNGNGSEPEFPSWTFTGTGRPERRSDPAIPPATPAWRNGPDSRFEPVSLPPVDTSRDTQPSFRSLLDDAARAAPFGEY